MNLLLHLNLVPDHASGRELTLLYGADGLMAGEFEEMARGLRLNRTVESVFLDLGWRSGLEDVNNFARVLYSDSEQNKTRGSIGR